MANIERYTYRVTWSEEDQEHVGLCAEFPSLSWLEENQGNALSGIVKLVGDVVADLEKSGETPPKPMSMKEYSGKFMTRVQPYVHRKLALRAAEEGKSINSLVASLLAGGV